MFVHCSAVALVCGCLFATSLCADDTEASTWSDPVNDLQARLVLVEKPRVLGVRWLVPYLELQDVRNYPNAMHVDCDERHLKIELVDKDGNVFKTRMSGSFSGPASALSEVILPNDSFMRISLECHGWGVDTSSAAMVSTYRGAWFITEKDKGKVFLLRHINQRGTARN